MFVFEIFSFFFVFFLNSTANYIGDHLQVACVCKDCKSMYSFDWSSYLYLYLYLYLFIFIFIFIFIFFDLYLYLYLLSFIFILFIFFFIIFIFILHNYIFSYDPLDYRIFGILRYLQVERFSKQKVYFISFLYFNFSFTSTLGGRLCPAWAWAPRRTGGVREVLFWKK